jgi:cysteine desulfurase
VPEGRAGIPSSRRFPPRQRHDQRGNRDDAVLAAALGTAAALAARDLADGEPARLAALRDDLHRRLAGHLPGRVHLNGPDHARLPNTLNVSIDGALGHDLLAATPQLAASTGSACHSGTHTPSPVLTAMGVDAERALAAVRLSLGRWSTETDMETAATALIKAAA